MKMLVLMVGLSLYAARAESVSGTDSVGIVVEEWRAEVRQVLADYEVKSDELSEEHRRLMENLQNSWNSAEQVHLLTRKSLLKERQIMLREVTLTELAKIRYIKGLQIIKILYEKVLSLDHHFAGVRTLSEINKMSNPNQYPDFAKFKELIQSRRDKRANFDMSAMLVANPLVSAIQTLTNLIASGMSKEEKEKELKKIECILDFTLRMQNDLNTIYFETSYLQSSNDKIKQDIEVLFRDYAKPIGYEHSLENCRANDDWEAVTKSVGDYVVKMNQASGAPRYRMQVDIEFPIDRLMQFINQYNSFIDQGGKFYEKFRIILNSYENQEQCETKLPAEYLKLKSDIDLAINKFNVAYKPVEVNGSKMKEILYGLNEFD